MVFFTRKERDKKEEDTPKEEAKGNNPYLNGRQEWLERYGTYIAQAKNWRMTAFITLIICVLSITGNVIQASQYKVVPYVVEVDKLGRAAAVVRADRASITPERLIQSVIGACIVDWRTVTADVELQKKMIERLSFFFAGSAKGVLKEWYTANNPYAVAKSGKLVHIELKSLPLPVGGNSYRIAWKETVRNHSGILLDQKNFEATVVIQIEPPTTEAVLVHNPGGIYITSLSATKVLNQ